MFTVDAKELDGFDKLEERIVRLLDRCAGLSAQNYALKAALEAKDREIDELREMLERHGKEKGAVKEKVELLLTRLNGLA